MLASLIKYLRLNTKRVTLGNTPFKGVMSTNNVKNQEHILNTTGVIY